MATAMEGWPRSRLSIRSPGLLDSRLSFQ
jgi:hypothetical protein